MMDKRATFLQRLLAAILDVVALFLLSLLVGGFLGTMVGSILGGVIGAQTSGGAAIAWGGFMAAFFAFLATVVLICLLSVPYRLIECFTGWTPGKYMLGLRVRNEDGSQPQLSQLVGRWAAANSALILGWLSFTGIPFGVLGLPLQIVFFLGCFLVLLPARQALHDKIAKTAVYPNDALE